MGFQEMTYKYFFGSDNRSIPYLNTLLENYYQGVKIDQTHPARSKSESEGDYIRRTATKY